MADKEWVLSHLFIATPHVFANQKSLRKLRDRGLISQEQYVVFRDSSKSIYKLIGKARSGRDILRRVMAINPEQLDEDFINLLRLFDAIPKSTAHKARLMIRSKYALEGRPSDATILTRYKRLFGVGYSEETINLMRSIGLINKNQADAYRFAVLSSKVTAESVPRLIHAKTMVDMWLLSGDILVDRRTIRAMQYAGLLNPRTADRLVAAVGMGRGVWRSFHDAKRMDGYAQRLAYAASGSFNYETMRFLRLSGLITRKQELILRPAVTIGSIYHRSLQEKWTARKYRPLRGETPVKTFARASKKTDQELLRLLSVAADRSRKTARQLDTKGKGKIGALSRSTQHKAVVKELHDQMQSLWEGQGYLTIMGQHDAARASLESNERFMKRLTRHLPADTQFYLSYNARANVDNYISRQENVRSLSRGVYKNIDLYTGRMDREINLALLQGKSATELADSISGMIRPNVPGGVSYAAMRLARTELANAFHITSLRYSRDMPWVQAYQWHLSGSHPNSRPDVCNEYADEDHDGLGSGVYKKNNVPMKPHPNCLCYITVVDIGEDLFIQYYKLGYYNRYLKDSAAPTPEGENSFVHDGIQSAFTRVGG